MKKNIAMLFLCSTTMCLAMENAEQIVEKNVDSLEIIRGVLVLNPNESIMYSPYVQDGIKKKLNLQMNEADPLVDVRALRDDGSSKRPIFLPDSEDLSTFPEELPVSILVGKKEGDTLEITTPGNTKIILTCNQKLCMEDDTFENRLTVLIKKFKNRPNWHLFDKKKAY